MTKKMVLAKEITKNMQELCNEEIIASQVLKETPLPHQHHPFLLSKLQIGTYWKKLILPS